MKNGFLILLLLVGTFCRTQTLLTQSTDQSVWNNLSGACFTTGPGTIEDTRFMRFLDTDDFNVQDSAFFVFIEFGVHSTSGGPYELIGRVHLLDGVFEFANMTLLAEDTAAIYPDSTLYKINIPFSSGFLLPGDTLIVEVFAPLNGAIMFDPGSNPYPETGLSYIAANACGFFEPIDYSSIGYPTTHLLLNLWVNHKPQLDDFTKTGFKDNGVVFQKSDFVSSFNDFDSDTLNMLRVETVPVNGVLELAGLPIALGDTIWSFELDQLMYIPNPGYVGSDTYSIRVKDGYHWSNNITAIDLTLLNWQAGVPDFAKSSLAVFPNPTNSIVQFSSDDVITETILFNQAGQYLERSKTEPCFVDLSAYPCGTYFVLVKTTAGVSVHEITRL